MHPFPPKPLYWETPESWIALHSVLNFLLSLAVLATVAGVLLRSSRKAQTYDIGIWMAAGVALTVAFIWIASYFARARDVLESSLSMMWIVVAIGSGISGLNLERKPGLKARTANVALILVIAFVALCAGPLLTPQPRRSYPPCKRNLHHIALALHNYHDRYDTFPAQAAGVPAMSWRVAVLPYLDRAGLRSQYDRLQPWDAAANLPIAREQIPTYTCPSVYPRFREREGLYFTSYAAIAGPHTLWQGDRPMAINSAKDGTSNTLLVIEACGRQIVWTEPRDIDVATTQTGINLPGDKEGQSAGLISGYHTGGAHGVMADGTVRFISADIDPAILESLLTADGGEEIGEF